MEDTVAWADPPNIPTIPVLPHFEIPLPRGMRMPRRRNKGEERDVAVRRIDVLLARARAEALAGRGELADRYAHIGLAIAEKYQTGRTPAQKTQVCRGCTAFLVPGRTSRTRIAAGRVITTCLRCHHVARRPIH